jgi:16S rRNA (guanine527-N7)-methyltransferase
MIDPVFEARLRPLATATDIILSDRELELLWKYYSLLERWNARMNLTGLPLQAYPEATLVRLLIEPLMARELIADKPIVWYDLGSGGGSPAIPLKIARPHARLTLIESKHRKAAFLREAIRELELPGATVAAERFEDLVGPSFDNSAELITVRAVRIDAKLADTCLRLLRPEGHVLLFGATARSSLRGFQLIQRIHASPISSICKFVPRGTG